MAVTGLVVRDQARPAKPDTSAPQRFTPLRSAAVATARLTVAGGDTVPVRVTALRGVPDTRLSAVAVHVSVQAPRRHGTAQADGTVTIAPWSPVSAQADQPGSTGGLRTRTVRWPAPAGLVSYRAGASTDGFALVGTGTTGAVLVTNRGKAPVQVSLDVQGYVTGSEHAGADTGTVTTLSAPRTLAVDATMGPMGQVTLSAAKAGLPASATGVLVNVTARGSHAGQLRSAAGDSAATVADYDPSAVVSATALVPVTGRQFGLVNDSSGPVALTVTAVAYVVSHPVTGAATVTSVTPAAVTAAPVRVPADGSVSVPAAGLAGIPAAGASGLSAGITVSAAGHARGTDQLAVGVSGPGNGGPPQAACPVSASPCSGFVVVGLSSPVSDGDLTVRNYSAVPVLVSLDAYGYLASLTAPGAPLTARASQQHGRAVVSWRAPVADGGAPVTGYTVTVSPGGRRYDVPGRSQRIALSGLSDHLTYTFLVSAVTSAGTGPSAVARTAPPGLPAAPTSVRARQDGPGRLLILWHPGRHRGASAAKYVVTAATSHTDTTVRASATSALVSGIAAGQTYIPCVTAVGSDGAAAQSCASPIRAAGSLTVRSGAARSVSTGGATAGIDELTASSTASGPAGAAASSVPGAPTAVKATAGNARATVSWTAPASNGGSAITSYTVTASDGTTATTNGTTTSVTVTGLTNGTAYTFTVTATNAVGTGPASAASNSVTPTGPPGAPDITSVTPGNGQVAIGWAAPSNNGGQAITGYTVTTEPGGATVSKPASATSATITGLTNGTSYTFTVTASNQLGAGTPSDPVGPVTPLTVPGAPTAVTATAATASAIVSWTAPATETSLISGYTVTATPGGASVTVTSPTTAVTMTGLTNGTSYTFKVTATDSAGTGPASAASNAVTPGPVPGPPTDVTATVGSGSANVSWTPPSNVGGSVISGYTVTSSPGGATVTVNGTTTSAPFTGLTNGTAYQFTVVAANSYGNSAPSAASEPVTPTAPAPPDAPFITNVTARDSAIDVTWAPPDSGTANLTGYVITVSSGGTTVSTVNEAASATEATVTGLTDGTDYTFTIAAVNGNGTSASSPSSVAVAPRPATAPLAPSDLVAVAQNAELQVQWVAPPDGGSAITGYTVSVSPASVPPQTTAAGTTEATITGLTNGTAYTVSVTAANGAGTGPAAQAGPATPKASIAPAAPTNVIASTSASGAAALQWTPPADPGTATITGFTVKATTGGAVAATLSAAPSACTGTPVRCTATMSGLTTTKAYTFTVTATNSAGTSAASAASAAVTPNLVTSTAPVVLSSASVATLRQVDTDGSLIFEQPPSQVTGLTPGQLVYVPQNSAVPQGFLGHVGTVSTQGGFVVVATTPATLSDAYSAYGASLNLPFNAAASQLTDAAPGVTLGRPTVRGKALAAAANPLSAEGSFSADFDGSSLVLNVDTDIEPGDSEEGSEGQPTVGAVVHLEASVTLTPILTAGFSDGVLNFEIGGTADVDAAASIGVHLQEQDKVFLGKILGPVVDVQVGEIPVPSQVVFSAYAVTELDGSIGIQFHASYAHTSAAQCTIAFVSGAGSDGCSPVDSAGADDGGLDAGVTPYASLNDSVGVQLGASLQIAFVAGPEITFTPELAFTADTTANPWWELDIEGQLGVEVTAFQTWGAGESLYSNDDLITIGPIDVADAGGPFSGMTVTPGQATLNVGDTQPFDATVTIGGVTSNPDANWSVVAGPGTITSSGVYTATQNGVAIIEADYDGMSARASVVVGPMTGEFSGGTIDGDTRGVVDAAVASWVPPYGSQPDGYAVVAQPEGGGGSPEVVFADGTATHAYIPNLVAGASYGLTVYATGASGGIVASVGGIIPLTPISSALGGTKSHGDIATNPTTGLPDDTGTAGEGGAAVSSNGNYVFFFTEARSNLAPASIYDPSSEDQYLVRKNLLTGEIDVASIGPDGKTPIPASTCSPNDCANPIVTNYDGSAVFFWNADGTGGYVYDFTTQTTWEPGSGIPDQVSGSAERVFGLSQDGTVVGMYGYTDPNATGHIYRQAEGGSPVQADHCPEAGDDTCLSSGSASMTSDGSEIFYVGWGPFDIFFSGAVDHQIYEYSNGADTLVFGDRQCVWDSTYSYNCDSYDEVSVSGNGSRVVAADLIGESLSNWTFGVMVNNVGSGYVGAGNVTLSPSAFAEMVIGGSYMSPDGNNWVNLLGLGTGPLRVYEDGFSLTAPQPSDATVTSVSLANGGIIVYTLDEYSSTEGDLAVNYPGVYEFG